MKKTREEWVRSKRIKLNTHSRVVKLLIVKPDDNQKILDLQNKYNQAFTLISSYIFQNGREWQWSSTPYMTYYGDKLVTSIITQALKPDLIKLGINKYHQELIKAVISNYASYAKRFRQKTKQMFPVAPIKLKINKGLRFDGGNCKIKNGLLYIANIEGGLNYKFCRKIVKDITEPQLSTKNFGGTLVKRNGIWVFNARYIKPQNHQYQPQDWIGTDFNSETNYWITLYKSNGFSVVKKPQELSDLENKIEEANKTLNDRTTTGGKRRYFNILRKKLHKSHKKLIRPIMRQLAKTAKNNSCGIIIDFVRPGNKTWGQDKLTSLLPQYCVNHGIPCYINNPAYTSMTCPSCGYVDKKNRNGNIFKCVKCSYENNSHYVGAMNCRAFGMLSMKDDVAIQNNP